ncbi:hypothetical protein Tco_0521813 [Tanacetum coccineum]
MAEGIENKEQWEGPEFQDTASSGQEREAKVFTFYRMEKEGERENNQGSVAKGIENKEQWEGPEFQDTASSGQEREAKVFTFYRMEEEGERYFTPCYVGGLHAYDGEFNLKKSKRNKKRALENFHLCYSDVGPSLSIGKPLTQEEAAREALAIDIGKRFSILKEERPVIETMAYSDKYKKILDGIVMDKLKLDGEIKKEEEEAIKQTFHAAKASLNTEESDSDDEEDNGIQRNSFGAPIYGPKPAKYLNCNDLMDRALALQEVLNPFKKVYVWKKAIVFLGSLPSTGMHDDEADSFSSRLKRARITENVEEGLMGHALHEFLMWGNYWNVLNTLGYDNAIEDMLEVRVNKMGSDEFDKVVADDELMTKKVIKYRLCGKAYAKSILDFAKRLGLYTDDEIQEYGFETYIIRGLRNDDDFSADQYWINISSEETLTLSRSLAKTIRKHVIKVLQKLITYGLCQRTIGYDMVQKNELWLLSMFEANHQNGYANVTWLIAKWKNKKGVGTQRESLICCGQFVTRIAKRLGMLSDEVLNRLSAPTYCKALDANILRELISSNGTLIPEEIPHSIPRVATPRAPRPTSSNLYDKISQLETR